MKPSARRRAQRRKAAKARARANVAKRTLDALGGIEESVWYTQFAGFQQTGGTGGWVSTSPPVQQVVRTKSVKKFS